MSFRPAIALLSAAFVVACGGEPGEITRDTQPFDGIAEGAQISLIGTEPFWALEIERDRNRYIAVYSTPENPDGLQFDVDRFAGNNGVGFNGEMEGRSVQVAIAPGDCSDQMSSRRYPYTATVALGDEVLYGCAHTSDEPFEPGATQ